MIVVTVIGKLMSWRSSKVFLISYHFSWFRLEMGSVIILTRDYSCLGWLAHVEVCGLPLSFQTANFDYCCYYRSSLTNCSWYHYFDILTLARRFVLSAALAKPPATLNYCYFHIVCLLVIFAKMNYLMLVIAMIDWSIKFGGSSSSVKSHRDSAT